MWQPRLIESARMKYLGIVEALEADLRSGRVARGERLPPQRDIAEALDVDLTTVTRAFNEARRRGFCINSSEIARYRPGSSLYRYRVCRRVRPFRRRSAVGIR